MIFKQFYLPCLAHASYLIVDEATGTTAVVDPQRDTDQYQAFAAEHGLKIKHVNLTHLHAELCMRCATRAVKLCAVQRTQTL